MNPWKIAFFAWAGLNAAAGVYLYVNREIVNEAIDAALDITMPDPEPEPKKFEVHKPSLN